MNVIKMLTSLFDNIVELQLWFVGHSKGTRAWHFRPKVNLHVDFLEVEEYTNLLGKPPFGIYSGSGFLMAFRLGFLGFCFWLFEPVFSLFLGLGGRNFGLC